jgi:hypothetical protein
VALGKLCPRCGAPNCKRHRRPRRPSAASKGYNARWARFAREYLQTHPRCEYGDCSEPATDVHHRDGLGPGGRRGYDVGNLQPLCHSHHSKITAEAMRLGMSPGVGVEPSHARDQERFPRWI